MKQPTTVKEAKSMVKERWLDHRVEKLARENDELREAVGRAPRRTSTRRRDAPRRPSQRSPRPGDPVA